LCRYVMYWSSLRLRRDLPGRAYSEQDDQVRHEAEELHAVEEVHLGQVVEPVGAFRRPGALHRDREVTLRRRECHVEALRRLRRQRLWMEEIRCGLCLFRAAAAAGGRRHEN